ncbi:hypothetical protein ACIRPU_43445 [Streptomyces sp. NPDC102259]|uniref:hypothetical protein n=1 Tax=Streptomyces sp. NPDC102259 TaxID=3366148 RepID=UPI00380CAA4A
MCAGRPAATASSSGASGWTWSCCTTRSAPTPGDRLALHHAMREAFVVLEEAVAAGRVAGYGVATWAGLEEEAFTVEELLALATEAAGGHHHLAAVQLPVSLVMMAPIVQALDGRGPCRSRPQSGRG